MALAGSGWLGGSGCIWLDLTGPGWLWLDLAGNAWPWPWPWLIIINIIVVSIIVNFVDVFQTIECVLVFIAKKNVRTA